MWFRVSLSAPRVQTVEGSPASTKSKMKSAPASFMLEEIFRSRLANLLSRMADLQADAAVVEVGASPLELYNGALAYETLRDNIRLTVCCAPPIPTR